MAQEGGIGVIHKNLTVELHAKEIEKVKKYESGIILDPICVTVENTLYEVKNVIEKHGFSGFPVVDADKKVLGIITNRDIRYEKDRSKRVEELMTGIDKLVTAPQGISLEEAKKILHTHRIEKLPLVESNGKLIGLLTVKDIEKSKAYPNANKDKLGRLRVAGAIGVGEKELVRAKAIIEAGVDAILIDTAQVQGVKI
jgi:IMP dehydrogenase